MRGTATGYGRTRLAALATLGACAVTFFATGVADGAAAQSVATDVEPGRGLAIAETEKVDPRTGSLSLGITTGRSIAGHQNTVAQASSQAFDFGVIGSTMAAQGCDGSDPTLSADKQPSAIQVDSRSPDSTKSEREDKLPIPAEKYASANQTPYGEAVTTTAPQDYGLIKVGGGIAKTHSGLLDDGKVREALASVDIDGIEIPVAGVTLSSLHWEATWRSSDPANGVSGVFSIGSASVQGQGIPVVDPTQALDAINGALAPLGFQLKPPKAYKNGDVVFVDPMGISVFQSQARDALTGKVTGNGDVSQTRQDLFDALLKQDCGNATYITIFDIVVGSLTGGGSFSVLLGGVQASSGDAYQNSFCLGCGGSTPSLGVGNTTLTPSSGFTSPANAGASFQGNTTPGPTGGAGTAATTPIEKASALKGKRGGALAGVALAGLGLMGAMAEGDRRKMRKAQKEIPQLEE